jgi:FdhE protein
MAKPGLPGYGPVPIGEAANPVFVRLPDPLALFTARAARFTALAEQSDLKPYLLFLAELSLTQHRIQSNLPAPELPEADALARAREFGMPPLDRNHYAGDSTLEGTLDALLSGARSIAMPEAAVAALAHVSSADDARRRRMAQSVLAYAIPMEELAEHGFVAAALQVHFARLANRLDVASLVPVGDGACPVCGGPPATSIIVGWHGAHGSRYCGCSLCGTLWNYVRIKCTLCGSTKNISYQQIEGGPGTIKAETCGNCRSYVKIFHQHKDPALDWLADDVASLGLDLLMRDADYRRGGVNPFLVGY